MATLTRTAGGPEAHNLTSAARSDELRWKSGTTSRPELKAGANLRLTATKIDVKDEGIYPRRRSHGLKASFRYKASPEIKRTSPVHSADELKMFLVFENYKKFRNGALPPTLARKPHPAVYNRIDCSESRYYFIMIGKWTRSKTSGVVGGVVGRHGDRFRTGPGRGAPAQPCSVHRLHCVPAPGKIQFPCLSLPANRLIGFGLALMTMRLRAF
ncbi:hypothetical protein EVAR_88066_1 [Eumeta japonica]|uniref:Uncharacterized protein n=1 Tax=Eumeta variegata TaxID=151549 RepID=A0A4C1WGE2_EUMVA|nr:hypothetical protein EVAR_88066_1 [Eumeta japonica]